MGPTNIPIKLRTRLAPWLHLFFRFPLYVRYWWIVLSQAPLEKQIAALPLTPFPTVFWIAISDIKFNGYIEQSHQKGYFCSGQAWKFPENHLRKSIFEDVDPTTYRYSIHRTIKMMFVDKIDFHETPQFLDIAAKLRANPGKKVWGCQTLADVEALFLGRIAAFQKLCKDGYRTQKELGHHNFDEISLYLTAEGEYLKGVGGNHRILMAELAGITHVSAVLRGANPKFIGSICQSYQLKPHEAVLRYLSDDPRISHKRSSVPYKET